MFLSNQKILVGKTKTRNKKTKTTTPEILGARAQTINTKKKKGKKNGKDRRKTPLAFMVPFCYML